MKEKFKRYPAVLILDLIAYIICLAGINHLSLKANLPFSITGRNNNIVISESSPQYKNYLYKEVYSINGLKLNSREKIEIYLDGKNIGDKVTLSFFNNLRETKEVKLENYYSKQFLLVVTITGTLFFVVAIFILLNSNDKKSAWYYHAVNILTAVIIMTSWGNYTTGLPGIMLRIIFHLAYSFAPAIFLHFVFVFPSHRENNYRTQINIFYLISLILFFLLNYLFVQLVSQNSIITIENYSTGFAFYRIFMVFAVLYGLALFINSYRSSVSIIDRKKIKWVLYGLIIGPGSFIILWVIPQALSIRELLSEGYIIIFMSAVPITFGISIYKYHLLDIDLIINRSWVYTIVLIAVTIVYTAIVGSVALLAGKFTISLSLYISAGAAIVIGFIFQPLKILIQEFVDKKFFRLKYNFRAAHNVLTEEIKNSVTSDILSNKVTTRIKEIILPEEVCFFLKDGSLPTAVRSEKNAKEIFKLYESFDSITLAADLDYVESRLSYISLDPKLLFKLIVPAVTASGKIAAFIAVGKRKSGIRYNDEDIDFLRDVAHQSAMALERIMLQKELLLKEAETEKLHKLNELKSLFVSGVSHDLKVPLTSIKLFTELLQNSNMSMEKRNEYLKIIEGEGERLTRLINNVLNYAQIEKGIKVYNFQEIILEEAVAETVHLLKYQAYMSGHELIANLNEQCNTIYADKDAVKEAIINLISNAIKYSNKEKDIYIKTYNDRMCAIIEVKDSGRGIDARELESVFLPYYRSEKPHESKTSGTGIGLSIVRHIMDAHHGKATVESILGAGSCFKLSFPLYVGGKNILMNNDTKIWKNEKNTGD